MTDKKDMPEVIWVQDLDGELIIYRNPMTYSDKEKYVRADTRPVPDEVVEALEANDRLYQTATERWECNADELAKCANDHETIRSILSLLTAQEGLMDLNPAP